MAESLLPFIVVEMKLFGREDMGISWKGIHE